MDQNQPDWRASLPDDLKGAPALKDVKDVGMLAKNYLEAQSALGGSLRIPSKEATPEQRAEFRKKILEQGSSFGVTALPQDGEDDAPFFKSLGHPEKPDAYLYEDAPPADVEIDDEEIVRLREVAHKAKLTPKQFKAFVSNMLEAQAPLVRDQKNARARADAELKKEWGEAYDTRRAQVGNLLKEHKAPDLVVNGFESGMMDPASVKWLYGILSGYGETTELTNQGKGGNSTRLTPAEALARVEEVEAQIAKLNPGDPEYQTLVQRRVSLMEKAYPQAA